MGFIGKEANNEKERIILYEEIYGIFAGMYYGVYGR